MNELQQMLAMMATKEQVINALGITEEQSDEFWATQLYTVKNRFLSYLLFKHRLDMTLVSNHIPTQKLYELAATAEDMINVGLQYYTIRQWWKNMGTFLHNRAFDAQREREKISKMDLVVLIFYPSGRPLYLTYSANRVIPVADRDLAYGFPIMSISDLNKTNLANMAKDFDSLVKDLGATHVKVLPRQKD